MANLVLEFTSEKDTPGTRKFKETTEGWSEDRLPVGTMYLTKAGIEKLGGDAKKLRVTVEVID